MAKAKTVKRAVTEQDLELNPELVEQGVEVGTIMKLPPLPEPDEKDIDQDEEESEDSEDESDQEETDEEESDESDEEESPVDPKAVVSFKIRNPNDKTGFSTRTFSLKVHGKNYKDIAAQFEKTNTHLKPTLAATDPEYKAHVDEIVAHNAAIKHPIIHPIVKKAE